LNKLMGVAGISAWRSPPHVNAPAHDDRTKTAIYSISDDLTGANRANIVRTTLYQIWVHLHGVVPPLNNAGVIRTRAPAPTLSTLADATACFQGIRRPHLTEDDGNSVLVYVLKPMATVEFYPDMVAPIRGVAFPDSAVLTVQVCLKNALQNVVQGVDGLVTKLEMVAASASDKSLPLNFDSRYAKRNW
jgi:hypothetical protein